jgi:hypothetical protein
VKIRFMGWHGYWNINTIKVLCFKLVQLGIQLGS